jgi:PilZ domain
MSAEPARDHTDFTPEIPAGPGSDADSIGGTGADRRRHMRFRVQRPGKVFHRSAQMYTPATSVDLSFAGALLNVHAPAERPYQIGEIVDVGLALSPTAVVPSSALLQGVVVRASAVDEGVQQIAVRYVHAAGVEPAARAA